MGGQRFARHAPRCSSRPTRADHAQVAGYRRHHRGRSCWSCCMSWLNKRSLEQPDGCGNQRRGRTQPRPRRRRSRATAAPPCRAGAGSPHGNGARLAAGQRERRRTFSSGMLQPGQTYTVPATATAPVLKTGKPEALGSPSAARSRRRSGRRRPRSSNVSLLARRPDEGPAATPPQHGQSPPPRPHCGAPRAAARARRRPPRRDGAAPTTNTANRFIGGQAGAGHSRTNSEAWGKDS